MKTKNIGIAVAAIVVVIAVLLVARISSTKKPRSIKGKAPAVKVTPQQKATAKKTISKDMGVLRLKVLNSKGAEQFLRARAFRSLNSRSSVYASSLTSNKPQEIAPGSYDIEIDTVPQKIYKSITVYRGKETVEDLGNTGSINVKALNYQKKDAGYPVRIMYPKTNIAVTGGVTNRPIELVPGIYDIEIGTLPAQSKKEIKVEPGKEALIDVGATTGSLVVKAADGTGKEIRYTVRVKSQDKIVASGVSNRPIEVVWGKYNVELLSNPVQSKNDLVVSAGETAVAEFTVQTPPAQSANKK